MKAGAEAETNPASCIPLPLKTALEFIHAVS